MYSKVRILFSLILATGVVTLFSCSRLIYNEPASSRNNSNHRNQVQPQNVDYQNQFVVQSMDAPPEHVQTVQLYRKGIPGSSPVIELNSSERLKLEFDVLKTMGKQYDIEIVHCRPDWTESALIPDQYLSGSHQDFVSGADQSTVQDPQYLHYEYTFPQDNFGVKISGNYLLKVLEFTTGQVLFSVPFAVHEDAGNLKTRAEQLHAKRSDGRPLNQLFSNYEYPGFVEMPSFNLDFYYAPNKFWGRSQLADIKDISSAGVIRVHQSRDKAFVGNYEFRQLDLSNLSPDGVRILDYSTAFSPHRIILKRDVVNFGGTLASAQFSNYGVPQSSRHARYLDVHFTLETSSNNTNRDIYLVGDFNNWQINHRNKLEYNPERQMWEGRAFVKQGVYAYKYVVVDGNRIEDLQLENMFRNVNDFYTTFIYFQDPVQNYQRLLNVETISVN